MRKYLCGTSSHRNGSIFFFFGMVITIRALQNYFTCEEILYIHNNNHAHKQQDQSKTCLKAHFVISSQLYIGTNIHILLDQMKTNADIPYSPALPTMCLNCSNQVTLF